MHTNSLWLIFIAVLGVIASGYTLHALYRVYQYSTLTRQTLATHVEWTVHSKWTGRYFLEAAYAFSFEGHRFEGATEFGDETFINRSEAEKQIQRYQNQSWTVWHSPRKFSYSSLQKKFPSKECGSAAVMLGLLCYFIFLGFYTGTLYTDGTDRPQQ